MITQDLIETFHDYFDLELAKSDESKRIAYSLRYQVFAEEFGFENVNNFPNKMEQDEYDSESTHCIIYHIPTGEPAACIRIIPASYYDKLPVEKYCKEALYQDEFEKYTIDRSRVCEISRLAVSANFRKRKGESVSPIGSSNSDDTRAFPLLSIACFLSATLVADLMETPNGIAVMESFLPRITHRVGINFKAIGRETNYHGLRTPYCVTHNSIIANMSNELRELYDYLAADLRNQLICLW